jgi:hypothetical protein
MPLHRAICFVAFLAAMLALTSCGDNKTATVKGTVTFDGKPIESGSINFVPVDGTKAGTAGTTIKNGQYSLSVPIGLMRVQIGGVLKVVGRKKAYDTPESKEVPIYEESIPRKYSNQEETELEFEVKPGVNEKKWDLKSE